MTTLEAVLQHQPDHPGACHYYVHAVEASPDPQRAACAMRLPSLMPGAGHLVTCRRIYMRVGRYRDISERNAKAATVDQGYLYLLQHPREGQLRIGILCAQPSLLECVISDGRAKRGSSAGGTGSPEEDFGQRNREKSLRWNGMRPRSCPTMARFGQWGELIRQPPPPKNCGIRPVSGITCADWPLRRRRGSAARR